MRNLVLFSFLVACTGDPTSVDPDAPDSTVDAPDGTPSDGSGADASTDAGVDATPLIDGPLGTPGMCAVATQTGCATGQGCYPSGGSLMNFDPKGACAVAGGLPVGGSCTIHPNCATGLVCEGGGGGNGKCKAICTSSATCPTTTPTCMLYQHGEYGRCL